jgi:hypothetical protein
MVSAISSNCRLRSYTIPTRDQSSTITYIWKVKKTRMMSLRRMSRRKKKTRMKVLLWSPVVRKRRRIRS